MKGISFYYRHLNIQYQYLVFDPPGLGTHCGLVWSELCTKAWYPGLVGSRSIIDTVHKSTHRSNNKRCVWD